MDVDFRDSGCRHGKPDVQDDRSGKARADIRALYRHPNPDCHPPGNDAENQKRVGRNCEGADTGAATFRSATWRGVHLYRHGLADLLVRGHLRGCDHGLGTRKIKDDDAFLSVPASAADEPRENHAQSLIRSLRDRLSLLGCQRFGGGC